MVRIRIILPLFVFILSACNLPAATPTKPAIPTPESLYAAPTKVSTLAVSGAPLGTEENPIVIALIPSKAQEISESAQDLVAQLSDVTGLTIVPFAPASYMELIEAMGAGDVHIAWLPPFPYLLAHEKGYADAALATTVFGRDLSAAQFLVNKHLVENRTFTAYFDPATGSNLVDASSALRQFEGKKPCWTDAYSPSGYVVPLGYLGGHDITVKTGAFLQGHSTVVKSLYLDPDGNICQFGATLVDMRSGVATDYTDVTEKVVVVWVTEAIIPFDGVVYATSLPDEMRLSISSALLVMIQTEEGNAALRDTYQIDGLKLIDDTFYDALRHILEQSALELAGLVR